MGDTATPSVASPSTYDEVTADWPSYYGLKLSDVGEDGAIVVLGHHEEQRRVVAALNLHAREFWGLPNLFDGQADFTVADVEQGLMNRWARFITTCEDTHHIARVAATGHCYRCDEITQEKWMISWAVKSTDDGAFPITHWDA